MAFNNWSVATQVNSGFYRVLVSLPEKLHSLAYKNEQSSKESGGRVGNGNQQVSFDTKNIFFLESHTPFFFTLYISW